MEHEVLAVRSDEEDDVEEESEDTEDDDEFNVLESDSHVHHRLVLCIKSRPCAICVYLATALVLLSSVVVIIVVAVLVAAPYHHVHGFLETSCSPVHISKDVVSRQCSCGKRCQAEFPCIHVTVQFHLIEGGTSANVIVRALLHENESMLRRQVRFLFCGMRNCKCSLMRTYYYYI